jgi:hypothetical protein
MGAWTTSNDEKLRICRVKAELPPAATSPYSGQNNEPQAADFRLTSAPTLAQSRKDDFKNAALPYFALDVNASAMGIDDTFDDREA